MAEWLLRQFGRLVPSGIVGSIPTLSVILVIFVSLLSFGFLARERTGGSQREPPGKYFFYCYREICISVK